MSSSHLSAEQLVSDLINISARAGHEATRDFHDAEHELYSNANMRRAQELKAEILARIIATTQGSQVLSETPIVHNLPESRHVLPGYGDRLE